MKPYWKTLATLASALALCASRPSAQSPSPLVPEKGGLHRVDPSDRDPNAVEDPFTRDFDGQVWRERLTQSDLDQRERSLDALEKRAHFDPIARAFLEDLARNNEGGELAWTARLALRELGRAHFPLPTLPGARGMVGDPFGAEPLLGVPSGTVLRMQELMNDLMAQRLGASPRRGAPVEAPGWRSVQVEQGPQGARVRVTGDGEPQLYEGRSLDDILERNPELAKTLGGIDIRIEAGAPLDLSFDLRGLENTPAPWGNSEGWLLEPQGRSHPVMTDRLGVVVRPVGPSRARELGLLEKGLGLFVERTVPDSFAYLLGVEGGDVLLRLDDTALYRGEDIERAMELRRANQELYLVWMDQLGQRQEKLWRPDPPAGPGPSGR